MVDGPRAADGTPAHAPVLSSFYFQGTKGSDKTERSEILPLNLKGKESKDAQKERAAQVYIEGTSTERKQESSG